MRATGLDTDRVVLVWVAPASGPGRVGSGYLIDAQRVLTAGHVWRGKAGEAPGATAEIWCPKRRSHDVDSGSWRTVQGVAWETPDLERIDACVLQLATPEAVQGELSFARYDGSHRLRCQVHGFPGASVVPRLTAEGRAVHGSANVAGLMLGLELAQQRYELSTDQPAATAEDWQGLSGAPVFADGSLVGIVTSSITRGYREPRLWVTPMQTVLDACHALGRPELVTLPTGSLSSYAEPLPVTNSELLQAPSVLLGARRAVVPFVDSLRETELEALDAFCDSDQAVAIQLLTGPGGSGKTRLLIEYGARRRRLGWRAGYLVEQREAREGRERSLALPHPILSEKLPQFEKPSRQAWRWRAIEQLSWVVSAGRSPTLIVIDYAESREELLDELTALVESAPALDSGAKLRIVLLARTSGLWWDALLKDASPRLSQGLLATAPRELRPVTTDRHARQAVFDRALQTFVELTGEVVHAAGSPDLSDELFARPLYLHMAALARLWGMSVGAQELLERIVDHECHFWHEFLIPRDAPRDNFARLETQAGRFVAAVTLHGGASTRDEAAALATQVSAPTLVQPPTSLESDFLDFLRRHLYSGGNVAYLRALDPDLLGEALVSRVVSQCETPAVYLQQVFDQASLEALRNGLTVLGRIATARAEPASRWIAAVLSEDVYTRAPIAFNVALAFSEKTAASPMGKVLAEVMQERGTLELATLFDALIPWETVSLRELAAWAAEECSKVSASTGERASSLLKLGKRLSGLGRREEALEATQEAVALRRQLSASQPDAFLPDLAMSLNNLGAMLSELGRREEALEATQEAAALHRQLSESRPDAFLPDLAASLNNLGMMLSKVGRREEALAAAHEAVAHYRQLSESRPDAFLPDFGTSLNNLGNRLSELGRREEALGATQEAVAHYRQLSESRPDAFLPDLATSLNSLGNRLSELGRREEALAATQEAVAHHRQLSEIRPDAFLPDFGTSLNNLGAMFSALGRREEAVQALEEAEGLYRRLVKKYPQVFLEDLTRTQTNLRIARQAQSHVQHIPSWDDGTDAREARPATAQPKPSASDLRKTLRAVRELLDASNPKAALALLKHGSASSIALTNARAVSELRAGNAAEAQQILGSLVLQGEMRRIRRDGAPELVSNYVIATLRSQGLSACQAVLDEAERSEATDALRRAIAQHLKTFSFIRRVKVFFVGSDDTNIPLPVEGVLIEPDDAAARMHGAS